VADDWIGITPGSDGLLILSLIHCLLKAGRIDTDYLARYTNAPVLLNGDPKSPDFGLFLRDESGKPQVVDRATGGLVAFDAPGVKPDLTGHIRRAGVTHSSVMHSIAERYLDPQYAPEAVAERCGLTPERIRALAGEIARTAFDDAITLHRPWTDFRGERHATMTGRPVAIHAMRGISAHANGFQTCRALHVLQILLGAVETPGGMRFKPPYPKPAEAHPRPHFKVTPGQPLNGPHLGYPQGPEDLALDADGRPLRIDKAFTWDNPMSAHGLMHMVISNAHAGDPYRIDTLFLYMANMAWNSSMNSRGVMEMLTDTDENGDYVIPRIIYSDAYSSEMVAYADLILPDTTYLERHDCISLLDRPISEPDAAADAIRWPVVEPDRDVRGFQSVLLDLGARLGLPGMVTPEGQPQYADYADYILNHQRKPGIGPLAGWRLSDTGLTHGRGAPNDAQIDSYISHGGFCTMHIPEDAQYYKPWNTTYQDWAVRTGLFDSPTPYLFQLYVEPLRKFQRAAEGHGPHQPPDHLRAQIMEKLDPLPLWYAPDAGDPQAYPVLALTQRPMAMYHSWGTQNAWLRQLHGHNPMYLPTALMRAHDLQDGDWARISSPHGEITVPVMEMAALNPQTIWTWNAIGKRKGAWALEPDAPEATRGFLLNHIIHELLPPRGDGLRWANSDPVTGQAAWFDLRVAITKADPPPAESQPAFDRLASPVGQGPEQLKWKSPS
jgi:anaerobic selenocysteine-containing dehydrogenase